MIIITEHGTKFKIDLTEKTWERVDKTGDSGNIRSESGTFEKIFGPVIGERMNLLCPPYNPDLPTSRFISTSIVVNIEET